MRETEIMNREQEEKENNLKRLREYEVKYR
jgi:hypothetical protein